MNLAVGKGQSLKTLKFSSQPYQLSGEDLALKKGVSYNTFEVLTKLCALPI